MVTELSKQTCEACRVGAPKVSDAELKELIAEIPDWTPMTDEGILKLDRLFNFKNFAEAMDFSQRVGDLAEAEGHHPAILTEWGKVRVTWWTHKIKGLHRNDFIMAAKTDSLFN